MGITASIMSALGVAKADTVDTSAGKVKLEPLASLEHPWAMAYLPDGRLLITEKPGRLRVFDGGKLSEPIANVPKVAYRKQGGLLGLIVDTEFATNSRIYISFVEAADGAPTASSDTRDPRIGDGQELDDTVMKGLAVASATLRGNALEDVKVLWRQEPKMLGRGHFGGHMALSRDGYLFITSGDRQRFDPAHDLTSNAGKIIRIKKDGSLPADNPLTAGGRKDIWSMGHRNPLGLAFVPESDVLFSHEMGPKGGDEVNLIVKGGDYGWPKVSDGDNYDDSKIPRHATAPEFLKPVRSWNPAISPSGFVFYTDDLFQRWNGKALMGGLSSKSLFVLTLTREGQLTNAERIGLDRRIRDVAQAPDGSIMLLEDGDGGKLLRMTPAVAAATR